MSKRTKSIATSIFLTLGFVGLSALSNDDRVVGVFLLSVLTVILFAWVLREGLGKNATLLTLILPALYTLGVGLFWFLLPSTIVATLPILILYGVGLYALSLTMNIFNVSTFRTIALSRAAKGVGFVLTLFVAFLLYDAILSIRANLLIRTPIVFLSAFPLFLQGLWSSILTKKLTREYFVFSAIFSFGVAGVSVLLFFWPVSIVAGSLFLTVASYVFLGLGQAKIEGRLFKATAREYLIVGFLVFIFMVLSTKWR